MLERDEKQNGFNRLRSAGMPNNTNTYYDKVQVLKQVLNTMKFSET